MGWCCKGETCQSAVAYHLVQRLLRNKNVDFIEFLLFFTGITETGISVDSTTDNP